MAVIRVVKGSNTGDVFVLKPGRTTVGRDTSCCDIVLPHHAVSRKHCIIDLDDEIAYLEDLKSRNGTYVNSESLTPGIEGRRILNPNDWIEINGFCLAYEDDSSGDSRLIVDKESTKPLPEIDSAVNIINDSSQFYFHEASNEKLRNALGIIEEITGVIELKDVFARILDVLLRHFEKAHCGFILLRDTTKTEFDTTAVKCRDGELQAIPLSQTVVDYVAAHKQAILSTNVDQDDRFIESSSIKNLGMQSLMCAPLLDRDNQAFGIIQMDTLKRSEPFNADELDVFAGVARHIAVAIQHSRLQDSAVREQRIQQRRLRTLIDFAPEAIVVFDTDSGKFIDANENAVRLYGRSREELFQCGPVDVSAATQPDGRPSEIVAHEMIASALDGQVPVFEWTHVSSDGKEIPCEIRLVQMPSTDQSLIRGSITDITDRKRAEQELRSAYDEMEQRVEERTAELARSNNDLESFAYIVSHDLQEPLRSISGFCDLLKRRYHDQFDEKGKEFIGYVIDGASHMQNLIRDLLHYSRVTTRSDSHKPIDCVKVFDAAVANLKALIEEGGAIVRQSGEGSVLGDRTQLVQLFQNLIGNAIKFRGDRTPEIDVRFDDRGDVFHVQVQDNGIGFDMESADRIFLIFQQLHPRDRYEGTGVGLAICKKVVERHGGDIQVQSALGEGTTFSFNLPKAADS